MKQLASLRAELCKRFSASPAAKLDWALRESAASILTTMNAGELRDFARELAPPAERANANLPSAEWKSALMAEIFRHWSLLDPAAASLGLADRDAMNGPAVAFGAWMERDPLGVAAWLDGASFPPGNEEKIASFRMDFIKRLAAIDFPAARKALTKLEPKEQERILFAWSNLFPLDPEKRMEVMDLLKNRINPDLAKECRENLITGLTLKSPDEAFKFVKASALQEADQRALNDCVLGVWARKDLNAAFSDWKARNEAIVPTPLLQAVSVWSSDKPGTTEAVEWVVAMDRGSVRDQFQRHLVASLARDQHFREAAELGFCLNDPGEREKLLKTVRNSWEQHNWSAASEWFAGHLADERAPAEWKLK